MRFQVTHKLVTYLLALAAMATVGAAGLMSGGALVLALACGAPSWFVDPGTRAAGWVERVTPILRLGAIGFFAVSAYSLWAHLPEPDLDPILRLVLFLIVYKLYGRAANRDYLQIYVLAFLMVLAGAAFAQSIGFALAFVAYVVLTTWALILLHLRREMEENYLVKHSGTAPSHKVGVARILNSRRVVGGAFLAATAAVAVIICVGAALTFALVPRVGAGFSLGGPRARKSLIGFSDEVSLGTPGFLSPDDETVALRAVVPRLSHLGSDREREAEMDRFYWRGTVYERYEQGRWLRLRRESLRSRIDDLGGPLLVREPHTDPRPGQERFPPLAGTDKQEIDIVGVAAPVAFALDRPVAYEIPPPVLGAVAELRLLPRWSGEVAFQSTVTDGRAGAEEPRAFGGAHYVAYSRDPFATAAGGGGRPLTEVPPAILAPYLALPPSLSPRVSDLAREVTAGKTTPAAKVLAVVGWLERTHEYSLDLGRRATGAGDPVETFLFDRKAGHCEYFASAAALMLRAAGVPTRYVNGFLGGEWNAVGQYVTVRQNRAHAWVEAYLGESGWMRVDATPPVLPPGRMGKLRQLLDSLDFFWGRWVVGYDLGRQIDLARDLGRSVGVASVPPAAGGATRWPWKPLVLGLALAALVAAFSVAHGRRRSTVTRTIAAGLAHQSVGRLYRRCLERLAERGHPRRPSETPRELLSRLREVGVQGIDEFGRLTDLYLQARFGRKEIGDGELAALTRLPTTLGLSDRSRVSPAPS